MSLAAIISMLLLIAPAQAIHAGTPCDSVRVIDHLVNWGHRTVDHPRRIEAIIIHSSFNALTPDSFSVAGILREYRKYDVSPHYIIGRKGKIYRLVRDRDVAYHAGESRLPDGTTDVNAVSIGIEIVNTPDDPPTPAQYKSLASLIRCLDSRYHIKYILGHKDIAPQRKTDPWKFDWKMFFRMIGRRDDRGVRAQ